MYSVLAAVLKRVAIIFQSKPSLARIIDNIEIFCNLFNYSYLHRIDNNGEVF